MKRKLFWMITLLFCVLCSCQDQSPETLPHVKGRKIKVYIENETPGMLSGGRLVTLTGGKAEGDGYYDLNDNILVSATPDPGYEIEYFYGGPKSNPRKFDYARDHKTSYSPELVEGDHLFKVNFRKLPPDPADLDVQMFTLYVADDDVQDDMDLFRETVRHATITTNEWGKVNYAGDELDGEGIYDLFYEGQKCPEIRVSTPENVEILGWAMYVRDSYSGQWEFLPELGKERILTPDMVSDLISNGTQELYLVTSWNYSYTPRDHYIYLEQQRKPNSTGPYNGVPVDYISNVHWTNVAKSAIGWDYEYRLTSETTSNCGSIRLFSGHFYNSEYYVEINGNWCAVPDEEYRKDDWSSVESYDTLPLWYQDMCWYINGYYFGLGAALVNGQIAPSKVSYIYETENKDRYILSYK